MDCTATPEVLTALPHRASTAFDDFEGIVTLYRPKVFRFILASLREQDAAETLTQDCFFRAFKARDRFRQECSVDTWLMQIAVNLVRDHIKNRRLQFWRWTVRSSRPMADLKDVLRSPERTFEQQVVIEQQLQQVWAVVSHLPERQRTVFLLRFVEEMDLAEIVEATGLKMGTVKTHLFRALHTVRERLGVAL